MLDLFSGLPDEMPSIDHSEGKLVARHSVVSAHGLGRLELTAEEGIGHIRSGEDPAPGADPRAVALVLRHASELLRDAGCTHVILGSGSGWAAVAGRAGFTDVKPAHSRGGQLVRATPPAVRLFPPYEGYAKLLGLNIATWHRSLAGVVVDTLAGQPGIDAVLGLGSIGRDFGDRSSDIDLLVLARGAAARALPTGEHFIGGVAFDLFGADLDVAPPGSWSIGRRQAVEEAAILWCSTDFSPDGLRSEISVTESDLRILVAESLFGLGWIGCHPPSWTGTDRYGYPWEVAPTIWEQRGNLHAANATLDKALRLAMNLMFLALRRLPPDPSWAVVLCAALPLAPPSTAALLSLLDTAPRTWQTLDERVASFQRWVTEIVTSVTETVDLSSDLYREFVANSSEYRVDA